ncbi:MAG: MerR family transcriptional regulator [Gammaproteobacteria bacterium]|nr:MerR family transcriptional regulator [Gammaproteobacteria bacterium]
MSTTDASLHIAAVERDTGIPKDTLRVWERRYGFPKPGRNDHGERTYPVEQVATLRLVKQLVDSGHRPNRVVGRDPEELRALLHAVGDDRGVELSTEADAILEALRRRDANEVRETLRGLLMRHGLERFVVDILAPLTTAVGEAWASGRLAIHEEHLFSEQVDRLLGHAIGQQPGYSDQAPMLLATLPGELHRLGLRMVEAIFTAHGVPCISIGPDVPVDQLVDACSGHRAAGIALSISACGATPAAARAVLDVRAQLPDDKRLWVGGQGAGRLRPRPQGRIEVFDSLTDLAERLDTDDQRRTA